MTGADLLLFAKGPAFAVALVIFTVGVLARLIGILMLRRKHDFSVARGDSWGPGISTVLRRSLPTPEMAKVSPVVYWGGFVFHIGLFVVVLFFVPHILVFKSYVGFGWPGLPSGVIEAATIATLVALIALGISRWRHPVRRFLSGPEDWITWGLTILPLLTGWMAVNRLLLPYDAMLAVHILSVEALMIAFPFTKLMHAVTLFFSRWYTGAIAGRKGAHS